MLTHVGQKKCSVFFSVVYTFVFVYKRQIVFGKDNLPLKDFIVSKNCPMSRVIEITVGFKVIKLTPIKVSMPRETLFTFFLLLTIIKIHTVNSQTFSWCGLLSINERFNMIGLNYQKKFLKEEKLRPIFFSCHFTFLKNVVDSLWYLLSRGMAGYCFLSVFPK